MRARSMSAVTMPVPVGRSPSSSPHGSKISAWPYDSRLALCRPTCAAAMTKHWFSIARARSSVCQWAAPVWAVNAAGTSNTSAPRPSASSRYSSGKRTS